MLGESLKTPHKFVWYVTLVCFNYSSLVRAQCFIIYCWENLSLCWNVPKTLHLCLQARYWMGRCWQSRITQFQLLILSTSRIKEIEYRLLPCGVFGPAHSPATIRSLTSSDRSSGYCGILAERSRRTSTGVGAVITDTLIRTPCCIDCGLCPYLIKRFLRKDSTGVAKAVVCPGLKRRPPLLRVYSRPRSLASRPNPHPSLPPLPVATLQPPPANHPPPGPTTFPFPSIPSTMGSIPH